MYRRLGTKEVVYSRGLKSIPMIESDRDSQFGDTVIKSKVMVELLLLTSGHIQGIPILFDTVDIGVPGHLDFYALDGDNLFVYNVTGHLWNPIITKSTSVKI